PLWLEPGILHHEGHEGTQRNLRWQSWASSSRRKCLRCFQAPGSKQASHLLSFAANRASFKSNSCSSSRSKDGSDSAEVYEDLEHHYRHRLAVLSDADPTNDNAGTTFYRRFTDMSRELLHVERQTAVRLRKERRISDEVLRELEHELDLNEARLAAKDKK
ncbi:MAG TPA: hypothetical protein VF493_05180, partial [Terriglobales bacterium]